MSEYKQGIDKIGIGQSFPFPIKLTYDNDYVYLTILKLPTWSELKNEFAKKGTNYFSLSGNTQNSYKAHLWLTVETLKTSNEHGNKNRKIHQHKFISFISQPYNNLAEGQTYRFDITKCLTSTQSHLLEAGATDVYAIVRGTFRYGGPDSRYSGRTRIYSNTTKIIINN